MDPSSTQAAVQTSTGYFPLFLTLLLAGMLAALVWIIATFLGPRRPSKEKLRVYECGIRPKEPVHERLDIQFYRLGILFLILGVEVIFFFPWALALANGESVIERLVALVDMIVFAVILVAAFVFAWAKGGFQWFKPHG